MENPDASSADRDRANGLKAASESLVCACRRERRGDIRQFPGAHMPKLLGSKNRERHSTQIETDVGPDSCSRDCSTAPPPYRVPTTTALDCPRTRSLRTSFGRTT